MTYEQFKTISEEVFAGIPAEFREGVDGLEVSRKTVPHPELPEIYTLGECLSDFYPSDYGGAGEVRSRVVLYYGSFLQLSRSHDDWDWEEEIYETITHEIRHHLEHLALEDDLTEMDYAEDQNFARRDGRPFDPFFFHSGHPVGDGIFEVDGDVFIERMLPKRGAVEPVELELEGRRFRVPVERRNDEVRFVSVTLEGEVPDPDRDVCLVVVPRPGFFDLARDFLGLRRLKVVETQAVAEAI